MLKLVLKRYFSTTCNVMVFNSRVKYSTTCKAVNFINPKELMKFPDLYKISNLDKTSLLQEISCCGEARTVI